MIRQPQFNSIIPQFLTELRDLPFIRKINVGRERQDVVKGKRRNKKCYRFSSCYLRPRHNREQHPVKASFAHSSSTFDQIICH
ncbi:hypothetical protein V6N12_028521 [Hibiscus sabdariffa]|uniref:Uncharacterized protein n=1 Tax=Hibiscus sabdariffa TaxID=183260 RepID=A0ABR2F630_9ROSI